MMFLPTHGAIDLCDGTPFLAFKGFQDTFSFLDLLFCFLHSRFAVVAIVEAFSAHAGATCKALFADQ